MLPGAAWYLHLDLGPELAKGEVLLSHLGHGGGTVRAGGGGRCVRGGFRVQVRVRV